MFPTFEVPLALPYNDYVPQDVTAAWAVETDKPGEWPVPVCSETVRQVMVE